MKYKDFYSHLFESIKDIVPTDSIPREDVTRSYEKLSNVERQQLGKDGFISYELWPKFRKFLLDRSIASNPSLNVELTAYTPGETLHLLEHPIIKAWREDVKSFKVPNNYRKIIFVPCAKTKPWENATRGIYKDYNKLKKENPEWFFVTISEPLGIVPQTKWNDFPQYDNPGLFKDTVQRSGGLFTSDFKKYFELNKQHKIPFDEDAYANCISILSETIRGFIENNRDIEMISFVEDFQGVGTHSDMLTKAGFSGKRLTKRESPRNGPYDHIKKNITEVAPQSKKLTVYHGTGANFRRFNLKNSTQGIIWFTSNKNKIINREAGASGNGFIITAEVTINNPAGWDEYHRLGIGELKRDGFDGVILEDSPNEFDCFVFDPRQIKILKKERV